jgi:hypothetical protein
MEQRGGRSPRPGRRVRGSTFWRATFLLGYGLVRLLDPGIRLLLRVAPFLLPRTVELRVAGRRSGRERRTLVTLLTIGDHEYLGHPNGWAAWTLNLDEAGLANLVRLDGSVDRVTAVRLVPGPEREAVIRATWFQQPFPANLLYSAARAHVRAVGVYFRLAEAE